MGSTWTGMAGPCSGQLVAVVLSRAWIACPRLTAPVAPEAAPYAAGPDSPLVAGTRGPRPVSSLLCTDQRGRRQRLELNGWSMVEREGFRGWVLLGAGPAERTGQGWTRPTGLYSG